MSADPTPPQTDTDHFRTVLRDLIDLGASFARLLHNEAQATATPLATTTPTQADEPPPSKTATLAVAFERVSRAVRRGIALARTLDQPPPNRAPPNHTAKPTPANRLAARRKILRDVEDTIARNAAPGEAQAIHAELCERLDAPEFEDDLAGRPVADIITEICRDLGLDTIGGLQYWKRRTPADIATLHARAAAPPGHANTPTLKTTFPTPPGLTPGLTPGQLTHHIARTLASPRRKP